MDLNRLGTVFRAVRIKKVWRQSDVAERAGVTRATVSRLERGKVGELTVDQLLRIAAALDISTKIVATWQGGDLDRLLNARHAGLHESVARFLRPLTGWEYAPEVSFSIYGERGVVDILAWHAETRTLLVIELKTEIVDINDLMGSVDQKRRLATTIAAERGWRPLTVAAWVIVADSTTNRRRVERHAATLRAAFRSTGARFPAGLPGRRAPSPRCPSGQTLGRVTLTGDLPPSSGCAGHSRRRPEHGCAATTSDTSSSAPSGSLM